MRILGFSRYWNKLNNKTFTTFRFKRRDRDWHMGEVVQVVYKPRTKEREVLGTAEIIGKEPRCMGWHGSELTDPQVTNEEANADGFPDIGSKQGYFFMWEWLYDTYGGQRLLDEPMNKLTLSWRTERTKLQ